jgi:hypothetical protein
MYESRNDVTQLSSIDYSNQNQPQYFSSLRPQRAISPLWQNLMFGWNPNSSTNYITGVTDPTVKANLSLLEGMTFDFRVIIPGAEHLLFPPVKTSLGPNLTTGNLVAETRNVNASVVLQAGSGKIAIPSGRQLQFWKARIGRSQSSVSPSKRP